MPEDGETWRHMGPISKDARIWGNMAAAARSVERCPRIGEHAGGCPLMGYIPRPPPGAETDERTGLSALIAAIVVVIMLAAVFAATVWATAGRDGRITYICDPGDTAVVRDGFGQKTPQCVTADGATIYWPDRVRVPTP